MKSLTCSAVLGFVVALSACGAARRFETSGLDQQCARQCEQSWEQCRTTCPQDIGAKLGCEMKVCNPARTDCLNRCPPASAAPR